MSILIKLIGEEWDEHEEDGVYQGKIVEAYSYAKGSDDLVFYDFKGMPFKAYSHGVTYKYEVVEQTEDAQSPEAVNTTDDYYQGDYVMEVIEKFSLGFRLGNVVKYVLRAGKKKGNTTLKDLKKAKWYLDREIEKLEEEENENA